ncbi:MAG: hypothetical protein PVG19_00635 [Desulfobacterales bacterium]|jgi:hypothetical protein
MNARPAEVLNVNRNVVIITPMPHPLQPANTRATPFEFNAYFPDGDAKVFDMIDADHDGAVSHDEGHRFKAARGMVHR